MHLVHILSVILIKSGNSNFEKRHKGLVVVQCLKMHAKLNENVFC